MGFHHYRNAAFAVVIAVAPALPAAAQNWVVYAPRGAGYSIDFPGQPKVSVKDVSTAAGTAKLTQATLEVGDAAYIASYIDYAPSIVSSRTLDGHLDAARDGQVEGGRLVSETRIRVSGSPARHVVIEKQGYVVVVRSVLVGRRLFQVAYVGKPGSENDPGPKRFHSSLQILKQ